MDLYSLLDKVSKIISPQTDYFYEYALHTFDDNGGFLRTRYCWWDKCLKNHRIKDEDYKVVLLTAEEPVDEESLRPLKHLGETKVKMQLDYNNVNASFNVEDIIFDIQNEYTYVYLIDLVDKTMETKHFVIDSTKESCIREVE